MTDRFPPLDQDARTYLVVAPDYADSKRLELRPQHFAEIKHGFASGHFLAGGATLDEQGSGMTGSFMIVKAPNAEAVRKIWFVAALGCPVHAQARLQRKRRLCDRRRVGSV
jgi:uncharacterized protein YciI